MKYEASTAQIWAYWETLPGRTKPPHIALCHRALRLNRGNDLAFHLIGPEDVPRLELDLHPGWKHLKEPAHRADYLRVVLLYKYGGFWVDSDLICFRPFSAAARLLKDKDFLAWEYRSGTDGKRTTFRVPISCFGVRPGCILMKRWRDEIHKIFEAGQNLGRTSWHALGREIIDPLVRELAEGDQIRYHAMWAENLTVPIKSKQRDKFFEKENFAKYIKDDPLQPHINYYNSWMPKIQTMSEQRLLTGDEVICKLFQYALRTETRAELLKEAELEEIVEAMFSTK